MKDLSKLKEDWKTHPCLRHIACENVEELAAHLERVHKRLCSEDGGPMGYLYQEQLKRIKNERSKQ